MATTAVRARSLFETAIGLLPYQVTAYLAGGGVPSRHGTAFPLISPYQVFHARDGDVMIAAVGPFGFLARTRVSVPCWPMRASSCCQTSTRLPGWASFTLRTKGGRPPATAA